MNQIIPDKIQSCLQQYLHPRTKFTRQIPLFKIPNVDKQLIHKLQIIKFKFIMPNCLYSKEARNNSMSKQLCTHSQISILQKQLAESHIINNQLKNEIDCLQRTLKAVLTELADKKTPSQTAQKIYCYGREQLKQKDRLAAVESHTQNLEEEIKTLHEVKNAYKAEVNRIAAENISLRKSNEELRSALDHKFDEVQALLEENMQLEQELKLRMRVIKRTQKQVNEYGKELKKNCSLMEAYEGEIIQTKARLANH